MFHTVPLVQHVNFSGVCQGCVSTSLFRIWAHTYEVHFCVYVTFSDALIESFQPVSIYNYVAFTHHLALMKLTGTSYESAPSHRLFLSYHLGK